MSTFTRVLGGAAGLAMIAGATAATAQYAPNGGYNDGGVVGAVLNSVLGGGRYGQYGQGGDRNGVDQCARAAEARVSADYQTNNYGGRAPHYDSRANDNRGYARNEMATPRVVGITGVERRNNGLKVSGLIDSGHGYNSRYNQDYGNRDNGSGGYPDQGYRQPNGADRSQTADLRFSCRVDFRGYVSNVKIDRMAYRRG